MFSASQVGSFRIKSGSTLFSLTALLMAGDEITGNINSF
jgi:hypothetical protein